MHEPDDTILRCKRIRAKADLLELAFRWKCVTRERSDLPFGAETHWFHLRGKLSEWKIRQFDEGDCGVCEICILEEMDRRRGPKCTGSTRIGGVVQAGGPGPRIRG